MKKLSMLLIIALMALFFTSCKKLIGEGPVVSEKRTGDDFTSIDMRMEASVYYKQDSIYRIEIKAQQNILNIIETPVINRQLVLRFKNNVNVHIHEGIIVNISAPAVNGFSVGGAGTLQLTSDISPVNCNLDISGSGQILIHNLLTGNLDATISGSGRIEVAAGAANSQTLKMSGTGTIDMLNLASRTANASISGSGIIKVNLSERLDAKISGSGNVYYKGTPVVSANISGSGKVVPL